MSLPSPVEAAAARLRARDLHGLEAELRAIAPADSEHADAIDGMRWELAMLRGEFADAWQAADRIRARGVHDPHRLWHGEDVAGKRLMVRSLHGLGDAVQAFRFAPRLRTMCASVVYEVAPPLVELAPCFDGVEQVITWGEAAPVKQPAYDVQAEITELPYLLRVNSDDLQVDAPYLHLPGPLIGEAAVAMNTRAPAVGLVWGCGRWNTSRDVPAHLMRELATLRGVEFWSLQSADRVREPWEETLRDASLLVGDGLMPLAATIANLDLVITADTLAAHLAGALGKTVWLLLQHAADWRWQMNRDDSPWYPTMRLFRQPSPGDWAGAVRQVRAALRQTLGDDRV